jgi:hypothetical protein
MVLLRFIRLNSGMFKIMCIDKKFSSFPYMLVYHLVDIHYKKESRKEIFQVILSALIDMTTALDFCASLGQPINESVVIPHIPVLSGTSFDLLFVTFCYMIYESEEFAPHFQHFLAILKNM